MANVLFLASTCELIRRTPWRRPSARRAARPAARAACACGSLTTASAATTDDASKPPRREANPRTTSRRSVRVAPSALSAKCEAATVKCTLNGAQAQGSCREEGRPQEEDQGRAGRGGVAHRAGASAAQSVASDEQGLPQQLHTHLSPASCLARWPPAPARCAPASALPPVDSPDCTVRSHTLADASLSAGCAGNGQQDDCGRGLVCALRERHALQSPLTQRTTRTRAHAVQPPPIDRASR